MSPEMLYYYKEPIKRRLLTIIQKEDCTYNCQDTVNMKIDTQGTYSYKKITFICPLYKKFHKSCRCSAGSVEVYNTAIKLFTKYYNPEEMFDVLL